MTKIVINACYGGFDLSHEAETLLGKRELEFYYEIPRDDPSLVDVVELLGEKAGGPYSKLKVVEIPDDVEWEISEYDGWEQVEEKHRSWG